MLWSRSQYILLSEFCFGLSFWSLNELSLFWQQGGDCLILFVNIGKLLRLNAQCLLLGLGLGGDTMWMIVDSVRHRHVSTDILILEVDSRPFESRRCVRFWAEKYLTWHGVHFSMRCLLDVPHVARPSRLCRWQPLPRRQCVLAGCAKIVWPNCCSDFSISTSTFRYIPIPLLPRRSCHSGWNFVN